MPSDRWPRAQVIALASRASTWTAALALVDPSVWLGLGSDDVAVWGRFRGTAAEPYDVVAHHGALRSRCTCPSSLRPCKHVLALLALWSDGIVPDCSDDRVPAAVREWCSTISVPSAVTPASVLSRTGHDGVEHADVSEPAAAAPSPEPAERTGPERLRADRVVRMQGGLDDLLRWIDDAVRAGLARPEYREPATFDALAARLVDAQLGGLANRVRRLRPSSAPDAHDELLAEIALWHLLASAGVERDTLDDDLRDSVDIALGWQVRQADVLSSPAETDDWVVMGRSDRREDRIDVRRTWLRGTTSGRWAVLLSFAATDTGLDDTYAVGACWPADLHRYPGRCATRALVGRVHGPVVDAPGPRPGGSVAEVCRLIGEAVTDEPWAERVPVHVRAGVGRVDGTWYLTDSTGAVPLAPESARVAGVGVLLACAAEGPVDLTAEWTPHGFVPLAVHLADRVVDIGPTSARGAAAVMSR